MFARYYNSVTGRFLSPDWDAKSSDPVPYAKLTDPQTLNLYSYVGNNPVGKADPDGHDFWDFVGGVMNATTTDAVAGLGRKSGNGDYSTGQKVGDALAVVGGVIEMVGGGSSAVGGVGACATGVGCVAGAPAIAAGSAIAVHGAVETGTAFNNLFKNGSGSYTNTHESGMTYDGKGDAARAQRSGARVEAETGDKHVSIDHTASPSDREGFKEESRRLDSHGGASSDKNHNKIESPGKKYREQDSSH